MKKLLSAILCISLICIGCAACSDKKKDDEATGDMGKTVMVEMEIQDFGTVKLELYPDIAPITVANFVKLAGEGFYDGAVKNKRLSRYDGFMIQGGDPKGNGTGGSSETIKGEFSANGVDNTLSHKRGVISMARSQSYDSASSQFFIMHADSPFLDGQYAAFGKVTDGMDVIDAVAAVECSYSATDGKNTTPVNPPVIKTVRVIEG